MPEAEDKKAAKGGAKKTGEKQGGDKKAAEKPAAAAKGGDGAAKAAKPAGKPKATKGEAGPRAARPTVASCRCPIAPRSRTARSQAGVWNSSGLTPSMPSSFMCRAPPGCNSATAGCPLCVALPALRSPVPCCSRP